MALLISDGCQYSKYNLKTAVKTHALWTVIITQDDTEFDQ
jgi:hypothetical protein